MCALMTHTNIPRLNGVTLNLNIAYLNGAREGDSVIIDAITRKSGRNIAFVDCELRHEKDNKIIARGTNTLYVGETSKPKK